MTELKVDNITNLAGSGKPNLPVQPTVGNNAAISTLNTHEYTSSGTAPSNPKNGALWWDSANNNVNVYIDGGFKKIQLNASAASGNPWSGSRAIFGGGDFNVNGARSNAIDYSAIQTAGNAVDFGDLTIARDWITSGSNKTRGLFLGGLPTATFETIDYITIGTTGNATDFGDLVFGLYNHTSCSDGTRALTWGGNRYNVSPTYHNTIMQTVIATTGNSTDFGDMTVNGRYTSSCSDATRSVCAVGETNNSGYENKMEYITTASPGNATDFGDLSSARGQMAGTNDATRGIFVGGWDGSNRYNNIEYITIQTAGNGTDFGDASNAIVRAACCADTTRALISGGYEETAARLNVIEYITVQTPGNATDYGDMTSDRYEHTSMSGD